MNDKTISLINQYDLNVSQIRKGRGGFIIETPTKSYFLVEFTGNTQKLSFISFIQNEIKPYFLCDLILLSKENQLFVKDIDDTVYILKEIIPGREFNYKNNDDIQQSFIHLATIHHLFNNSYKKYVTEYAQHNESIYHLSYRSYLSEIEKHTTECKHIKKYIMSQKNKTDFERLLLQYYDVFLEKAFEVTEACKSIHEDQLLQEISTKYMLYHGDYQYHNIVFSQDSVSSINYEHIGLGSGVRDFCYLFRKINEKNNWDPSIANIMIDTYFNAYQPTDFEWKQVYLMLSYPTKFWKIVNFYYNNRKSWISHRNTEKFECLLSQELVKENLLLSIFSETK